MKQSVKIAILVLASVIIGGAILMQSGVGGALMAFVLVGALPGTMYSLSANEMLVIIALITWLLVFRITAVSLISFLQIDRLARKRLGQKSLLPQRRFGQI